MITALKRLAALCYGRRRAIVASTLACVVLALLYSLVAPKRYLATAYLFIGSSGEASASTSTQADIANNPRVIRGAIERLERERKIAPASDADLERREQAVARNLTVSPPRARNVVLLGYTDPDPAVAAATANALASAYLDVSADLRREPLREEVAAVRQQMEVLRAQVDETRADLEQAGAMAGAVERQKALARNRSGDREQFASLQRNADEAVRRLDLIHERLDPARVDDARAVDAGALMTPARTPTDPVSPGMPTILPLAALAGLLLGVFAVVAAEQFRPRLRCPDDLSRNTGTEVLATIPDARLAARDEDEEPTLTRVVRDRTFSPVSAAARPVGNLLVAFGAMSLFDAEAVVSAQRRGGGSFGQNALSMGLISDHQLQRALSVQYGRPRVTASRQEPSASLVVDQDPDHPIAEALRALRSQLLLRPVGQRPGTMTITSVDAGDGRTFVATNLALAFAQIGKRVLLIDANLRSPSMHELFNVPNERGLSGYLARRHGAPKIHDVGTRGNMGVMLAGPIPPNPQELLSHPLLVTLLKSLQSVYELIVIDTPAGSLGADAQLLSARAGSTIIVGRVHATALTEVGRLSKNFARQGVEVLGTIVNEA